MANPEYIRVQNDTGRPIKDTLKTDGSTDDLTGATVEFYMWDSSKGDVIIDGNSTNVSVQPEGTGTVDYEFQSGDLDTTGIMYFEWEVTFNNGKNITYRRRDGEPKEIKVVSDAP